ncbi:MAG: hypothetical protein ABIT08_03410 [Bacteroidia bacterium]
MITSHSRDAIFIITSDEPLGETGNSHQHYCDVISDMHSVIFINPPPRWELMSFLKKPKVKEVRKNLRVFCYHNYFPISFLKIFFTKLNDFINCYFLSRLLKRGQPVIFWKFDHFRMINPSFIQNFKTIYHVVDPVFRNKSDGLMASGADLVVTVNTAFTEHYKKLNPNILYIPHGFRKEELLPDFKKTENVTGQYAPYFIITGSINLDLDLELLDRISNEFSGHNLVLIGKEVLLDEQSRAEFKKLISKNNVHHLGPLHYMELKNYIAGAEICLVPYLTSRENFFRNPIKITNYIAQLKPVINTVIIPELKILENKIVFNATTTDEFISSMKDVLNGTFQVDKDFVKDYISSHEYEKLVNQILDKLFEK